MTATRLTDRFEELMSLFVSGLLHKMSRFIYSKYKLNDMDYIIRKPGGLTPEEYEQVKRHVDIDEYVRE